MNVSKMARLYYFTDKSHARQPNLCTAEQGVLFKEFWTAFLQNEFVQVPNQ